MSLDILKAELLAGHPDTGAYNADDAIAADEINVVNRTVNKTSMTGSEVANAIDIAEFDALSAGDEQLVWNVIHIGDINPFGVEATIFTAVFGGGSTTITTLAAVRKTDVSRAVELGIGPVKPGHVAEARRL